jgi:pimeloyl-ACP methyl ester carboxylesterase
MPRKMKETFRLELQETVQRSLGDDVEEVLLRTGSGTIACRYHGTPECTGAVVWVGGAGGGLDGPAGGLYPRLAGHLLNDQIASLRLDYRHTNHLLDCVMDTLLGISFLENQNCRGVILVGHSFGGAVVISAGAASPLVLGVAALSSQTYGTDWVDELSPRSLLLMHGTSDRVLPDTCSREIYQRAAEPKKVLLYPGCGHGLDECRGEVDRDLLIWMRQVLGKEQNGKLMTNEKI